MESKKKEKGSGFQSLSLKFIPVIDAACTREYIIVISSTDCMCATDFDLPSFLSPCSFHTVYAISLFSFLFFDLPFLALLLPFETSSTANDALDMNVLPDHFSTPAPERVFQSFISRRSPILPSPLLFFSVWHDLVSHAFIWHSESEDERLQSSV